MKEYSPYDEFLACFNSASEIVVSTEELQQRMEKVNGWLSTLEAKERKKVARHMAICLEKAQGKLREKQEILEETILVNRGQIRANAYYGKY